MSDNVYNHITKAKIKLTKLSSTAETLRLYSNHERLYSNHERGKLSLPKVLLIQVLDGLAITAF